MITVTLPWWGWMLWIAGFIVVLRVSGWLGDKLGHAAFRLYLRRKTRRAQRDTIRAL